MDEVIKTLWTLILEFWGYSKEAVVGTAAVVFSLGVWLSNGLIKMLLARYRNWVTVRDLEPQFDYKMVERATKIFIPTQFQNASPARQAEPGDSLPFVSRSPLIPHFIKNAFNKKKDSERFYLVLADSGMGKTTFMINLYIRYQGFFNWRRNHNMRLLRFSHPDTMKEIQAIKPEEARNTILLLDALDEDPHIVSRDPNISDEEAFDHRVDEIVAATLNFSDVVISCRTQYFPRQENNPYEIKVKRPDGKGYYILNKLYLSPFTDQEVKKYLNKKYGWAPFVNKGKKKRALQIVQQSRDLVVRPMMLSYIDFLVEDGKGYQSVYAIYETLIEKWLIREAEKRKYLSDRDAFIRNLRQVSRQTALAIYYKWMAINEMFLTKAEAVSIAVANSIDLKPEEITGQSLLTYDGAGNWKFAHKSILEFFLAKEALENGAFFRAMQFSGMDMAKKFVDEKLGASLIFVEEGEFIRGGEENIPHKVLLQSFFIGKYPVTQLEYARVTGKNPSRFKGNDHHPVETVSWVEAIAYCNQLNQQLGLPNAYDADGNWLDADGKPTQDFARVRGFRLPTEAEWEYAARGGNQSKGHVFAGSDDVDEVAWHVNNSGNTAHSVGQKKPNELGLYDMSGNVWEWCHDLYDGNYYEQCKAKGVVRNPTGPESFRGLTRVFRGGSFNSVKRNCMLTTRGSDPAGLFEKGLGFRLVFVP